MPRFTRDHRLGGLPFYATAINAVATDLYAAPRAQRNETARAQLCQKVGFGQYRACSLFILVGNAKFMNFHLQQ